MKIKTITFEMGSDFKAILECEHCGHEQKLGSGYHDNFYHTHVIPAITCKGCGKNRSGELPQEATDEGTRSVAGV